MKNQFRKKLKRMILLGTLLPTLCFVAIFFYQYSQMNQRALENQFNEEQRIFESILQSEWTNYELELKGILDGLYVANKNESIPKEEYVNILVNSPSLKDYYYLENDQVLMTSDRSNSVDIKLQSLNQSEKEDVLWVDKLSFIDEPYLYFGYTDSINNTTIIFSLDETSIFERFTDRLNMNTYYEIYSESQLLHKSERYTLKLDLTSEGLIDEKNNQDFFRIEKKMKGSELYYIFYMDISREIKFVRHHMSWSGMFIILYFIIAVIILTQSSKYLLKPLVAITKRVTSAASDEDSQTLIKKVDYEFKMILDKFEELLNTSNLNMEAIKRQSEIIEDKNNIMEDLNQELEASTLQIEASTKEWMIYEKQSKVLVDNIKDIMWVLDPKGYILYINNVVEEKLGYNSQELMGVKFESLLKESLENEEALDDMFNSNLLDVDLVFLKKNEDSEEIYATSTKRVFSKGVLTKIQGVSRDITEERFIQSQMIQKNEISNTLNEISENLTKPENLEVLLQQIVHRIEKLLNPLICTIRLIDDQGRLELKAGIGTFYGLVQEKYLDIESDISGKAIRESKIIVLSDSQASDYDNFEEVSEIVKKSKEIIFLPLEFNDHVIGVMAIGLKDQITEPQLKILKVFTNQASAAIEKARMYEELEKNYMNIIKALASTVEAKDAYTEDHSIRVSKYSRMLAETLGLSEEEINYIDIAGLLHDIGKIGVSDLTLTKKGRLSESEFEEIKKHPLNGGRIVSEMKLHSYIVEGVLLHHKRFDLNGYPDIYVDSLPISARIIGVADAFDAMTSNRSYQKAKSYEEAYEELVKFSGTQFCPNVVNAMKNVIKRL
jgi:PAS domain S-box-containing protein